MRVIQKAKEIYSAFKAGGQVGNLTFKTIHGERPESAESLEEWVAHRRDINDQRVKIEGQSQEYDYSMSVAYELGRKLRARSEFRKVGIRFHCSWIDCFRSREY